MDICLLSIYTERYTQVHMYVLYIYKLKLGKYNTNNFETNKSAQET